jgi:DNA-binding IclR family transcriptional regulator
MTRTKKKAASDRKFVMALSRGLDVLRAFHPQDGLLGNQEIAARTRLPKPTVSRLTYTLTKMGYLAQVSRFDKYQLAPPAMAIGYAALANLGIRGIAETHMRKLAEETGGDVAVGARDRLSMMYFAQVRGASAWSAGLDTGSRIPISTTAMGRAYLYTLPEDQRLELLDLIRARTGDQWPAIDAGIQRAGEMMAKHGFTISAGEWLNDVHGVGVALRMNDGSGTYAFNCGAPSFRFNEEKLITEIGPRLVTMVRDIQAVLDGALTSSKNNEQNKRVGSTRGRAVREIESVRQG